MVTYGFVDVVVEFIACAAVLTISVALAVHWYSLLGKVHEACKARILHPDRDRLLYLVGLTPAAWGLAFAIYIRNVYLLGCMMADSSGEHFGQKIYYTLLDLYLIFVSVLGIIGLFGTAYFICKYRKGLEGLLMIIRFDSGSHQRLLDLELQRYPRGIGASPNFDLDTTYRGAIMSSDSSSICRQARNTYLQSSGAYCNAEQQRIRMPHPAANPYRRNLNYAEQARDIRNGAYRTVRLGDGGNEQLDALPSVSRMEGNEGRDSSSDISGESSSLVSYHGFDVSEAFLGTTSRALRPRSDNMNGFDECPLNRCDSCSEAHSSTVPGTRRALIREPLTPTSPAGEYRHYAMHARLSPSRRGALQADGAQQPLLAAFDAREIESEAMSVASTITDLGDEFPAELERYDAAIIGVYPQSKGTRLTTPATTDPEPSARTSTQSDKSFDGQTSSGKGRGNLAAELDKELGWEAQRHCEDFEENRRSLLQTQQVLRASNRGQAISAALALQRGCPIPSRSSGRFVSSPPESGCWSNIPPERHPERSPHNRRPLPAPQARPYIGVTPSAPSQGDSVYARPTRVMEDSRFVQWHGKDGHPTTRPVASPRLRLEMPAHTSLGHSHTAAEARKDSSQRQQDTFAVEDWVKAQRQTRRRQGYGRPSEAAPDIDSSRPNAPPQISLSGRRGRNVSPPLQAIHRPQPSTATSLSTQAIQQEAHDGKVQWETARHLEGRISGSGMEEMEYRRGR